MSTPMRRIRSGCCARAASGQRRRAAEKRDELAPFHVPPSSLRKDSTPRYGRRLLRCGISIHPMTAWGHSRHFEREVGMTASPQ